MICVNEGVKLRRRVDTRHDSLTLRREIFFGQLFATTIATIISHPISVMDCVRGGVLPYSLDGGVPWVRESLTLLQIL